MDPATRSLNSIQPHPPSRSSSPTLRTGTGIGSEKGNRSQLLPIAQSRLLRLARHIRSPLPTPTRGTINQSFKMQPRQRQETRPRRQQIPSTPPTSQPGHWNPNSNPSLEFLSSLELIDPILFPDDTMEDQQQQLPIDCGETNMANIDLLSPTFSPNFSSAFNNNSFPSPSQNPHSDQTFDTRNASCPTYPMTKTSSQTSNYFIVPTPSGLTGTSSFEQLHIRSYSDNSQRTGISGSESNGGAGYMSPPEDSCAIDTEMMDGTGETSFMPHDREQVLLSMSTAGDFPSLPSCI